MIIAPPACKMVREPLKGKVFSEPQGTFAYRKRVDSMPLPIQTSIAASCNARNALKQSKEGGYNG